jgi:hypothetical protein
VSSLRDSIDSDWLPGTYVPGFPIPPLRGWGQCNCRFSIVNLRLKGGRRRPTAPAQAKPRLEGPTDLRFQLEERCDRSTLAKHACAGNQQVLRFAQDDKSEKRKMDGSPLSWGDLWKNKKRWATGQAWYVAEGGGVVPAGLNRLSLATRHLRAGLRFQVSGLRLQVSGFRCQVSGVRCQVSGWATGQAWYGAEGVGVVPAGLDRLSLATRHLRAGLSHSAAAGLGAIPIVDFQLLIRD